MLKESSTSPHSSTSHPGRRVKHSRGGCVVCKERRLRCSEERPSCARCVGDGRACKYVLRLTWEDESIGRGVKHGRGTQSEVRFADPTPPRNLMQKAQWKHPRKQERYFLNTDARDVEHKPVQPLPVLNQITRRSSYLRPQYALSLSELGLSDGMLFQYYQSHICHSLTLVDEASNGYHQIILPMAITHDSVMSSLLAIGALYLSLNQSPSTDFYAVALHHKQKTLNCLRRDLASLDKNSTDRILVSMLLLCLFDITDNCQSSWPTHLTAAENLISIGDTAVREPSLASFVSNFFATRDVMGRTACGAKSKFKEITWHDPLEIDTTVGCSHELMKLISSITDLSRQMAETDYEKDDSFSQKLIALEAKLDNITQVVPELSQTSPSSSTLLLTQTAELIQGATNVYFYTALHSALPSTQLIRQLVAKQIKLLKKMTVLRSAHLWSIFVTALYVHNDDERIFFLEQFDRLEVVSAAMGPTQAARAVVETVWKRRDLDDEPTNYVGGRKISAMSDWNRIVRPMSEGLSLA